MENLYSDHKLELACLPWPICIDQIVGITIYTRVKILDRNFALKIHENGYDVCYYINDTNSRCILSKVDFFFIGCINREMVCSTVKYL